MVGIGGIYAELLSDIQVGLAPLTPVQAQAMLARLRGAPLLTGARGRPRLGLATVYGVEVPPAGDPPAAAADYAGGKRWCETMLARTKDFPWTVIRPPAVLGPADQTLRIAAYLQRVEDGGPLLVPVESYERQAGLAWAKDIGYACALVCDLRKDLAGKTYNAGFEGVSLRNLIEGIAGAMSKPVRLHPMPFAELPEGASPYGPDPRRPAGYVIDRARRDLGFEPSALGDALAETLAWYRVAHPSHPGYANRARELAIAGAA